VSDHPRDCPHGRQWGKCDTCDLATAHERIIGLVDENKQLQAERDYAALEYRREHALRLEIKAEAERLWAVEYEAMVMLDRMYPELYQTPTHLRPLRSALLRAERERERERE
jgi:hypothetical protein